MAIDKAMIVSFKAISNWDTHPPMSLLSAEKTKAAQLLVLPCLTCAVATAPTALTAHTSRGARAAERSAERLRA